MAVDVDVLSGHLKFQLFAGHSANSQRQLIAMFARTGLLLTLTERQRRVTITVVFGMRSVERGFDFCVNYCSDKVGAIDYQARYQSGRQAFGACCRHQHTTNLRRPWRGRR